MAVNEGAVGPAAASGSDTKGVVGPDSSAAAGPEAGADLGHEAGTSPRAAPITLAVMNFNGREVIGPALEALRKVDHPDARILVVDNGSSDGSPDWVRAEFPGVGVTELDAHGSLQVARSWALEHAPTRYVFLIDNDLLVAPDCPGRLLEVIGGGEDILAVTPRMLYTERPDVIHNDVGRLHYLGVSAASARGESVEKHPAGPPCPTIPGGVALVDRELAAELSYFDERYDFGWGQDAEMYVRGIIRGMRCLHAADALTYHPVPGHGTRRAEAQIHARYRLLLTCYAARTWWLLAPPLLAFEAALTALFVLKGLSGDQFRAIRGIIRDRADIRRRRAEVQEHRTAPDSVYLDGRGFSGAVPLRSSRAARFLEGAADAVFHAYWRLVRGWL